MQRVTVNLGENSYPILIGDGLLSQPEVFRQFITASQVMIVTNETIAPLYLDTLARALEGLQVEAVVIPDGEQYKTLDVMNTIITRLLEEKFSRDCTLIALGGGVVGDICGFAAACYQRGIDYIQVPTTILAQVDSSVGGKTAVNHKLGKNMIGAFHQPRAVITDITVLKTLNDRELRAGLSEVIKYGLIRDAGFFDWLEENIEMLLQRDHDALIHAIRRSCENKAEVVARDEKEAGERALLNLGHTFGHAIETGLDYKGWLHGEAVATGMLMAADLSCRHGWLSQNDVDRVMQILAKVKLPLSLPEGLVAGRMQELMAVDKKARGGKIRLVLLKSIGSAFVCDNYDREKLHATLEYFQS